MELAGRPRPAAGGWRPIGIWAMMFVSLILRASHHSAGAPAADELTLWLPALGFLALPTQAIGPLSPATGTLLAIPFSIVLGSRLAAFLPPGRGKAGWMAAAIVTLAVGSCLKGSYDRFLTIDRTARIRLDLVRQGRKLGLAVPEPRTSAGSGPSERGLLFRNFVDSRGDEVGYALYVPEDYRGDRPYPMIVFLHGFGDRGTTDRTNLMYTYKGLPFVLRYRAIDFLVLCPRGLSGTWEANGDDARRVMELLSVVQNDYRVDPRRISLTGLSSGGVGVCNLAARYPDRWAALVPVAGVGGTEQARSIKDIPIWCFHNRYDGFTPIAGPRRLIETMEILGGRPLYTEFLDTNHNAGERAYLLPELYDWLARQRRP